mmetsp:Transcript_47839/g.86255  ORF Transcript_47839/g.86255 Transcript_47839/m.86255 type:complete len:194 (-) Transcript_47839:56-637(-)
MGTGPSMLCKTAQRPCCSLDEDLDAVEHVDMSPPAAGATAPRMPGTAPTSQQHMVEAPVLPMATQSLNRGLPVSSGQLSAVRHDPWQQQSQMQHDQRQLQLQMQYQQQLQSQQQRQLQEQQQLDIQMRHLQQLQQQQNRKLGVEPSRGESVPRPLATSNGQLQLDALGPGGPRKAGGPELTYAEVPVVMFDDD